jgi:hypothetical protein
MKIVKKLLASALALALPCAALAQTADAPKKPEEAKPILTPYGFAMANFYFDGGGFNNKDNTWQALRGTNGGDVIFSARSSRLGFRLALKDDNWTGAELGGVLEFDFKAGQLPTSASYTIDSTTKAITGSSASIGTANTPSNAWYNGVMRLRLANMTATWKGDWGKFQILAGQDYGLVNSLMAESLAWAADPLFTEAGNIWRRSPQFRLTYGIDLVEMVNVTLAAAVLSPADQTTPVDAGAGQLSRMPDIELRAQVGVKVDKDLGGTVGFGYHTNNKRIYTCTNLATVTSAGGTCADKSVPTANDVGVNVWGVDADLNLTQYFQVKGEYFASSGADDVYTGLYRGVTGATAVSNIAISTGPTFTPLKSHGFWGQAIVKPIPEIWLTGGYGMEQADNHDDLYTLGVTTSNSNSQPRFKNEQLAFGLLFNAGRYWRFGVEYDQTTSTYLDGNKYTSQQTGVTTQVKF